MREATRRAGSPWGRRPKEPQHFKGIEGRRAQRQQRGNNQRYPENQAKRGLPRKPRGGRWGCWNGWGVHWGQSSGSTKGGPEGKPGILSRPGAAQCGRKDRRRAGDKKWVSGRRYQRGGSTGGCCEQAGPGRWPLIWWQGRSQWHLDAPGALRPRSNASYKTTSPLLTR